MGSGRSSQALALATGAVDVHPALEHRGPRFDSQEHPSIGSVEDHLRRHEAEWCLCTERTSDLGRHQKGRTRLLHSPFARTRSAGPTGSHAQSQIGYAGPSLLTLVRLGKHRVRNTAYVDEESRQCGRRRSPSRLACRIQPIEAFGPLAYGLTPCLANAKACAITDSCL